MKETLYESKWTRFVSKNNWEYVERTNPKIAAIIPILDDGQIILIKQHRIPVGKVVIEIPAGIVEDGEDSQETAERELIEETGYKAGTIGLIAGNLTKSAGISNELLDVYEAKDLTKVSDQTGLKEEGEDIELLIVDLNELKDIVQNPPENHLVSVDVIIALHVLYNAAIKHELKSIDDLLTTLRQHE